MSDRIAQALTKLLERHRIVFWYDKRQALRDDFEALQLPGVEKLELTHNEYGIKYRLLREQPEQKFLLYPLTSGQVGIDLDNGAKVNDPKFGAALNWIAGLDAAED